MSWKIFVILCDDDVHSRKQFRLVGELTHETVHWFELNEDSFVDGCLTEDACTAIEQFCDFFEGEK